MKYVGRNNECYDEIYSMLVGYFRISNLRSWLGRILRDTIMTRVQGKLNIALGDF